MIKQCMADRLRGSGLQMPTRTAVLSFLGLVAVGSMAQETVLRSHSELVLVPVSISDGKGHAVRDLAEEDLVLYDNNVAREIRMEDVSLPLSLAIVVQTSPAAQIILNKLRKETGLLGPMLTGSQGEAAVIAFGREVKVMQAFSPDEDKVADAVARLDPSGSGATIGEAVSAAGRLLAGRAPGRRRVLLLISEKHDDVAKAGALQEAADLVEHQNITVYSVTFSPSATAWTNKVPIYCNPPWPRTKCAKCFCGNCGNQCDRVDGKPQPWVPNQAAYNMNLGALIGAAVKATHANAGAILANVTGGEQTDFTTKTGLDKVLERISQDLHGQYLLSFNPTGAARGEYRTLRVEVKGRRDLTIRFRPGYVL